MRTFALSVTLSCLAVVQSIASDIRLGFYGWQSAPVGCFDEAVSDTLRLYLPNLVGDIVGGSPYHFGFLSMGNERVGCCTLGDTEGDTGCHYDLTAWLEPGDVVIGHVNDLGWDQNAMMEGQDWLGRTPTDFNALRVEFQQGSPCNDVRVLVIPIEWIPGAADSERVVLAWGDNAYGQCNPPGQNDLVAKISAGGYHCLVLKRDGSIAAWGYNYDGRCDPPDPNVCFRDISAGGQHSLGLKVDGSILAWGTNGYGQCNVPSPNQEFIVISAGGDHSMGLRADGSVVTWGRSDFGQLDVPSPNLDFVAIDAGYAHSLGLKADGSVAAWGDNEYGQCNVPSPNEGYIAISAGGYHSLGLKSGGEVVAWGWNENGQCEVPAPNRDFIEVSAGDYHNLGLRADGSIATWGANNGGQSNVPAPNSGFIAVSAGGQHSIGLRLVDPMGACCLSAFCTILTQAECSGFGGVYQGNSTICDPNPCPTSGVDSPSPARRHLSVVPNPTTGNVLLSYILPQATVVTVEIFDASGAIVRRLMEGDQPAGQHATRWDGRDNEGRKVPAGVYMARVTAPGRKATGSLVLIK